MTQAQTETATDRRRLPGSAVPTKRKPADAELIADTGDFLDEVDELLEENDLEVVQRYRQRGGQ